MVEDVKEDKVTLCVILGLVCSSFKFTILSHTVISLLEMSITLLCLSKILKSPSSQLGKRKKATLLYSISVGPTLRLQFGNKLGRNSIDHPSLSVLHERRMSLKKTSFFIEGKEKWGLLNQNKPTPRFKTLSKCKT